MTKVVPIGVGATVDFIREVATLAQIDAEAFLARHPSRATWYARSVDSTYLTGKRVFIFGDASHAIAAARFAARELGFTVVGLGTYSREFAREIREAAKLYNIEALITDDYLDVEERVAELQPELVLGTQMERHIAKRLGVPCAVISAPVHVQDFPARYAPQMGFEGANVLFDTWVHPLMMGLEEHLLGMFREDFEFHEGAAPSHLGRHSPAPAPGAGSSPPPQLHDAPALMPMHADAIVLESATATPRSHQQPVQATQSTIAQATAMPANATQTALSQGPAPWIQEAELELKKIPFFVRGKARRNTERYALEKGLSVITVETLYEAKAHFGR